MSLPSALLGFAVFKSLQHRLGFQFTDVENVFVQSVAVATATGPLAYGFIGIIPAIEKMMTNEESGYAGGIDLDPLWKLVMWSSGLAFFGVFFAIPLRRQFVIREKLPFPSGSATATLISVFHGTSMKIDEKIADDRNDDDDDDDDNDNDDEALVNEPSGLPKNTGDDEITAYSPESDLIAAPIPEEEEEERVIRPCRSNMTIIESQDICRLAQMQEYHSHLKILALTSTAASVYTVFSYFVPQIRAIPIFGRRISEEYLVNFQPSPAYVGQGMIMGFQTTAYMLFGAILGWLVLSPLAKWEGWAPGRTDDWKEGSEGWIMWISLSIMISDSIMSLIVISTKAIVGFIFRSLNSLAAEPEAIHSELSQLMESNGSINQTTIEPESRSYDSNSDSSETLNRINGGNHGKEYSHDSPEEELEDVGESHLVPTKWVVIGLIASSIICVFTTRYVFGPVVPVYAIVFSIALSLILSILGVKALGETDLNPVSGIGKLSQLICAVFIPKGTRGAILINLISGAISEATTQQAGDLMQDLKTGYLLGASPRAQFVAQIYGSVFSIFMSSIMYKVYNSLYEIPGKLFKIPTAVIWIDCARLVNGTGLPPRVFEFSITAGIIFGLISLLKNLITDSKHRFYKYLKYLPDGVPVGIGIYNVPSFTFARFIGGLISYYWLRKVGNCDKCRNNRVQMIIFSSGLVLGEGLFSVVNMALSSVNVPHL
ncbi:DEKNAAC104720 [Brettanomyces naardenensis]|uniref:DEKNAAC104720 n=1 Tax=Brettanomyces naardenensis TaxID=13370 RepID=A0A448YRA8_BRENA|nr:DEKNAAC104720 [Brettanomyces naardenensis]